MTLEDYNPNDFSTNLYIQMNLTSFYDQMTLKITFPTSFLPYNEKLYFKDTLST